MFSIPMHFRHFYNKLMYLSFFEHPMFWFKTGPEFKFDIEKQQSNL